MGRARKRNSKKSRQQTLASGAADVVAGTAGAAASVGGALIVPPFGSLIGPAVSKSTRSLLKRIGVDRAFATAATEFASRQLSVHEHERVVLAYETAARGIVKLVEEGPGIRSDDFFRSPRSDSDRTPAEEVVEHVLNEAQSAYEMRKAERLGRLLVFIARRPDVRPSHANRLVELASRLTYQQLLWLGLFDAMKDDRDKLPDWATSGMFSVPETQFVDEVGELAALNLIKRADNVRITDYGQVNPRHLHTVLNGKLLVEGMELHVAESDDAVELWSVLRLLGIIDAEAGRTPVDVIGLPGTPAGSRVKINYRVVKLPPLAPLVREPEELPDADAAGAPDA